MGELCQALYNVGYAAISKASTISLSLNCKVTIIKINDISLELKMRARLSLAMLVCETPIAWHITNGHFTLNLTLISAQEPLILKILVFIPLNRGTLWGGGTIFLKIIFS